MSGQPPSKTTPRKVYRFALYGVSAAGKTCLLAALGMNRKPNPSGYDAVRLPCPLPQRDGEPQNGAGNDPAAAARRGEKWLDEATEELRMGRVPPPNPISKELMTYWFDISAPDRTWHVELFDYSGELVDARKAADPAALASKLQEHLTAMDGLLVLVAAPHPDDSLERAHQDLQIVKEAFTALRAEESDNPVLTKPVALLVNKWDRRADDLSGEVESERPRLEAFLNEDRHTAWQGVAQAIQNGVVPECFEIFPVSAFGKHKRVQLKDRTIERPVHPEELPAFGLEDPFVWAAQTIDERDLAHYEEHTQALREIGWPWEAGRMARLGTLLVRRFIPGTDERERAEKARSRCRQIALIRWGSAILCGILLLLGIEFLLDVKAHREALTGIESQQATSEHIQWLSDYSTSLGIRHLGFSNFVLSRADAAEMVTKYTEQQEAKLWGLVESAETEVKEYGAANAYLEQFPHGPHASEAKALIVEYGRQLRIQENNDWLAAQEAAAGPILESESIPQLESALAKLDQPPHPDDKDQTFLSERANLRNRLSKQLTGLIVKRDWEQFYAGYREAMEQQRFDQAAKILHERTSDDANLQKIRQQFAKVLPNELTQAVDNLIQNRDWEDAQLLLGNLIRDHVQWSPEMRFEGDAQLFQDQQQRVVDAHDRSLYEQVRKFRTEDAAKIYLDRHSPGPMQADVKKYCLLTRICG